VILALAGELARASANPACYDCNPILVSGAGAFRGANLDRSNTHSGSSEFDYGAIPHVEHLGKIRFRTISGLCLPCRFICATRRLGGNAKHRF